MTNPADPKAAATWQAVLDQVRQTLPRATYDTWLAGTEAVSLIDDTFTVRVPNTYAAEWIEQRLKGELKRACGHVLKRAADINLIVSAAPAGAVKKAVKPTAPPSDAAITVEIVDFNPTDRGYVQTSNYAIYFWQPLIGSLSFSVWQFIKSFAYLEKHNSEAWPSIRRIAETCANGNRERIVGRAARPKHAEVPGALDILEQQRMLWTERRGEGRDVQYVFAVQGSLPVLTPAQVAFLPAGIQLAHKNFLKRCKLDLERWQQLTLPTLLRESRPRRKEV